MRLLELTMPLDHQWMPDQLFPSATRFALAPRRHDEQGFTLGIDTGTSLLMPAQFAAFRGTRRLDDIQTPELVLRDTAVVDVAIGPGQEIGKEVLGEALAKADFREGDALLIRTGWGNGAPREPGHDEYMLDTPHLGLEGAEHLISAMKARNTNLLLLDTALVGFPKKHLVPEWTTLAPRPICWPSEAARAYLAGYLEREILEDWAVDFRLAEAGIMTVVRVVNCDALQGSRFRLVVAPMRIVRGVGSTCRVVAIEGEIA